MAPGLRMPYLTRMTYMDCDINIALSDHLRTKLTQTSSGSRMFSFKFIIHNAIHDRL